jgi:hypothetical protein
MLPLVLACAVALAEAAALVMVLRREPPRASATDGPATAPAPVADPSAPGPRPAAPSTAAATPAAARGRKGQRVASGGFGVTVEKVLHEPLTYKEMTKVGPEEQYVALLVAADNDSGSNAQLFPSQFRLQDAAGYGYDPLNLRLSMPSLEWRTLGNRETVRGYVDFIVPKSARGLTLIYAGVPHDGPPIYVELGE